MFNLFNFFKKKDNAESKEAELKKLAAIARFTNDFVLVEGGEYMMGDAELHNAPPHKVTVNSFYMQVSTVTLEFWDLVMGNIPNYNKIWKDVPVTIFSWNDIQKFINKLNSITGKKYRLPTEAEWEYAARGGRLSKGYKYAGSDDVNEVAWYFGNSHKNNIPVKDGCLKLIMFLDLTGKSNKQIHPVKDKKPNELGLYDMSGNVWEWCNDWYGDYLSNDAYSNDPQGPKNGIGKVIRGGSFKNNAERCLIAYRNFLSVNLIYNGGFRLLSPVE